LIGLSCAWELMRRGVAVRVLEREAGVEHQASWAGAGMLIGLGELFESGIWVERARESAALYPEFVASLGGKIDFTPGQQVDPRDLLTALRERVPVERRDVKSMRELTEDQVVIATGAWGGLAEGAPEVFPVKGYLLAWEGFEPEMLPNVLKGGGTYVFQRRSGRVIAGSTEQRIGFSQEREADLVEDLRRRAVALWPPLDGRTPHVEWFGFRPGTSDGAPVIRRWDARTVLAYGHFRNGILLAPWTARWVADELSR
jgi:glycine oxidase